MDLGLPADEYATRIVWVGLSAIVPDLCLRQSIRELPLQSLSQGMTVTLTVTVTVTSFKFNDIDFNIDYHFWSLTLTLKLTLLNPVGVI